MAYGATGINRSMREQIVGVQALATDFTSATAAGSTSAQTVTINDPFGKITCLAATTQASDAILTVTVTNSNAAVGDVCFANVSLSSGTAAGYSVLSSVVTANTITIVVINSGATAWAAPVFLINYMLIKALGAGAAN